MKIHATRVHAPTPGHEHDTKWQVAVTYRDGNTEVFDSVEIYGSSTVVTLPDIEPAPHVCVRPEDDARVSGIKDDEKFTLED